MLLAGYMKAFNEVEVNGQEQGAELGGNAADPQLYSDGFQPGSPHAFGDDRGAGA